MFRPMIATWSPDHFTTKSIFQGNSNPLCYSDQITRNFVIFNNSIEMIDDEPLSSMGSTASTALTTRCAHLAIFYLKCSHQPKLGSPRNVFKNIQRSHRLLYFCIPG